MSVTIEEFQKIKKVAEEAERQKNRAEGEAAAIRKRLREEFGCKDAKAGKALLVEKEKEAAKLEESLREKMEAFKEAYGDDF